MNRKNGLVVVHDPHNLYQFIWYYKAYGQNVNWTALCLHNETKKEYMSNYCRKAGIFKNVISTNDKSFEVLKLNEQFYIFIQMLFYFITGRRKKYCRKLIRKYVDPDQFDGIVVLTAGGIITGACMALSDEIDIVIMDDGSGEYTVAKRTWFNLFRDRKPAWKAFTLAVMGYSDICRQFPVAELKNCTKFLIRPDLYKGHAYKCVYKMFDREVFPMENCSDILERIYPCLDIKRIEEAEAFFIINTYSFITSNYKYYEDKVRDYISKKFHNIVIKTHPADRTTYAFEKDVHVYEVERTLPGELLTPYMREKKVYFLYATSMMMNVQEANSYFLVFKKLVDNSDCDRQKFMNSEIEHYMEAFIPDLMWEYID